MKSRAVALLAAWAALASGALLGILLSLLAAA
jgi:hypothetical protein